jgi:hypothetical protein
LRYSAILMICSVALIATPPVDARKPGAVSKAPKVSVQVSSVVNAIKCELAETFSKRNYGGRVKRSVAGSLKLTEVVAKKVEGEGGLEVELGAVSVGGGGSGSRENSAQSSLNIAFEYNVPRSVTVPSFCSSLQKSVYVQGDPFIDILDGLIAEYKKIEEGAPTVQLKSVEYVVGFDIEKESNANLEAKVLIFKVGGGYTKTATSSQELTLSFDIDPEGMPQLKPIG